MAAIFQMTFLNAFSWMKIYEFLFKFVPKGPISNIWNTDGIVYWHIYASLGLSELMKDD